jgi:molybdate transport system substrate-binding protein
MCVRFNLANAMLAVAIWSLAGCGPRPSEAGAVTLSVFTAASLTEAFTEIGGLFEEEHPGVKAAFNFAGSQQLAQQLGQGAPADVFASANDTHMEAIIASGRVTSGAQRAFALNRLVVIYPQDNPAGLTALADLAKPELKGRLVLAASEVPVGQYALDFLEKAAHEPSLGAAFKEAVLDNIGSYEENVKAVLAKVSLGEAFAGIVYTSDLAGNGASAQRVGRIDIPDRLNTIASYPIAVIGDSDHPDLAAAFVDFVLSPQGQAVLARHGFIRMSE